MNRIHHFSTNSMFVTVVERIDGRLSYLVRYPNKEMKRVIGNKINDFVGKICNRMRELTNGETITYSVGNSLLQ
jgi:hypothetical protein